MNTWIPLWTSTVDSTLWEEPTHVRVMFLTLLMLRDPDHVVRQPFRRLVKKANLAESLEESVRLAQEALKVLSEPDKRSIDNQEFGGRRIQEIVGGGGWLVLNGAKYDEEMRFLAARVRKTRKQRERRHAKLEGEVLKGKGRGHQLGGQPGSGKFVGRRVGSPNLARDRLKEACIRTGDLAMLARLEEMEDHVAPGSYGSYGPEAQEAVNRRRNQSPQEESKSGSESPGEPLNTDESLEATSAGNPAEGGQEGGSSPSDDPGNTGPESIEASPEEEPAEEEET